MAYNWMGNVALVTLLSKIKTLTDKFVVKEDGKGLSSNDYTAAEKSKLAGIETGAKANVQSNWSTTDNTDDSYIANKPFDSIGTGLKVESGVLKVDGAGVTSGVSSVNGKTGAVTISADDLGVYTKTEVDTKISSVYTVKGSVAKQTDLPTSDQTIGDVYNVTETGMNYVWTGTEWDALGTTVDLSGYVLATDMVEMTAADVNTAWSSVFTS